MSVSSFHTQTAVQSLQPLRTGTASVHEACASGLCMLIFLNALARCQYMNSCLLRCGSCQFLLDVIALLIVVLGALCRAEDLLMLVRLWSRTA